MVFRKIFGNTNYLRFNVAAWQNPGNGHTILIGREIEKKGKTGQPDIGRLFLAELDHDENIIHERIVWRPIYHDIYFEDPRALVIDGQEVIIGLTAVVRNKRGFSPFPAIVKINVNSWKEDLPPAMIIQNFGPGKNITPITGNVYLFRPEGDEYNHRLIVFSIVDNIPLKVQELNFPPDLSWAHWRIGTTMPPVWINDTEALLIIHGINIVNDKYIYSLGRAKLTAVDGHYDIQVAPDPILTPAEVKLQMEGLKIKELHPRLRQVLYACGGVIDTLNPDQLNLFVNVGDTNTVQFKFSLTDLKSGLNFR